MRGSPAQHDDGELGRSLDRLAALPIRPAVARLVHDAREADTEADPGWALARSRWVQPGPVDSTTLLAELAWWPTSPTTPAGSDACHQLWRHALTIALAARRLAREAADPDPDEVFRAGLLQPLGLWAVAALDPDRLARWIRADARGRLDLETAWAGMAIGAIGRRLAERWGVEPLVADAAWLAVDRDGDLDRCAHDPARLLLVRRGYALARRTPWSLDPDPRRDLGPTDPALRALTAEVQSRSASPLIAADADAREEALTRSNARLRLELARVTAGRDSDRRLIAGLATAGAGDSPRAWADRAALQWKAESGVRSASVEWPGAGSTADPAARVDEAPPAADPAAIVLPLGDPTRPVARLRIDAAPEMPPVDPLLLGAWGAWAGLVAERSQLAQRLESAVQGHRARVDREEREGDRQRLAALAEFAAGAGHELNNPLAVIMGRAQLLLGRTTDPDGIRSLRAIIGQVQRSHRILRDLMFVARPAEFRPRPCQPDEVVRASLRDLRDEAEAQGVQLVADLRGPSPRVWVDPEPLRQVADALLRNALEASTAGGTIRFTTSSDARGFRWVVHDSGRGIVPAEGPHLFDPFYCGRQAGRGLGLGLPRVARTVELAGGDLRWQSTPGEGSTFLVSWPTEPIPAPVAAGSPEAGESTAAA